MYNLKWVMKEGNLPPLQQQLIWACMCVPNARVWQEYHVYKFYFENAIGYFRFYLLDILAKLLCNQVTMLFNALRGSYCIFCCIVMVYEAST